MPDIYKNGFLSFFEEEEEEEVLIPGFPGDEPPPLEEESEEWNEEGETSEDFSEVPGAKTEINKEPLFTEKEIEKRVIEELKQVRSQARKQAYNDVMEEKRKEYQECLQKVDVLLKEMEQQHQEFLSEYRDHLATLALSIAEKVVLKKISEEDRYFNDLVTNAISSIKNADWITVQVSDQMGDYVEQMSKEIKKKGYNNVEVVSGPYPLGTCLLEIPEGFIDASVPIQFQNLRAGFERVEN